VIAPAVWPVGLLSDPRDSKRPLEPQLAAQGAESVQNQGWIQGNLNPRLANV